MCSGRYNALVASQLDADGMARLTADLASVAGLGQGAANLLLTPLLLQHAGVGAALLLTPIAYAVGECAILLVPGVGAAFFARALDFVLRYTINDAAKQMLFFAVPAHHVVDAVWPRHLSSHTLNHTHRSRGAAESARAVRLLP